MDAEGKAWIDAARPLVSEQLHAWLVLAVLTLPALGAMITGALQLWHRLRRMPRHRQLMEALGKLTGEIQGVQGSVSGVDDRLAHLDQRVDRLGNEMAEIRGRVIELSARRR